PRRLPRTQSELAHLRQIGRPLMHRQLAVAVGVLLLTLAGGGGCSTQTKFYTLARVDGPAADVEAPAAKQTVIAVGGASLPDYIDRPQIVVRESPYSVRPASFDQWAGDLDDMVPRVLRENLAVRLPNDRIIPFPALGAPSFDYRVSVAITQFDVSEAGEAV